MSVTTGLAPWRPRVRSVHEGTTSMQPRAGELDANMINMALPDRYSQSRSMDHPRNESIRLVSAIAATRGDGGWQPRGRKKCSIGAGEQRLPEQALPDRTAMEQRDEIVERGAQREHARPGGAADHGAQRRRTCPGGRAPSRPEAAGPRAPGRPRGARPPDEPCQPEDSDRVVRHAVQTIVSRKRRPSRITFSFDRPTRSS